MNPGLSILLFVVPLAALVLGAHAWLAFTVARAFGVVATGARLALFFGPLSLTLGLVASLGLLRLHHGPLTLAFAGFSAIWFALFVNLLLGLAGVWVAVGIGRLLGASLHLRRACVVAGTLALGLLGAGLWNGRAPRLVHLDVTLAGLPPGWRGRHLVHLSDLHVGTLRGPEWLQAIVARVNALEPALVAVTGDLFDGAAADLDRFVAPLSALRATHGVFYVTGNHEGYLGLDEALRVLAATPLRVLDHEVVDVGGLQVAGIPFPEHDRPAPPGALEALAARLDRGRASVLLFHTPTDVEPRFGSRGAQQQGTYLRPDTDFRFAREAGFDLQLSGHTHQGQIIPFTWLTRLLYRGFDHGLRRSGDLQVHTTSGAGTWGPPVRTGSRSEIAVITLR